MTYIIKVREGINEKYLFNTRLLVCEPRLAKPFSSQILAKRYLKKSVFTCCVHTILPIQSESDLHETVTNL